MCGHPTIENKMLSVYLELFQLKFLLPVWQSRSQPTFSVKNQVENIFTFVDHIVTATSTQLYHSAEKAAIDSK